MRHAFFVSASALLLAGAARAETGSPPTAAPPTPDVAGAAAANAVSEVVVVATRTPELLDKVGQSVTVLTLPQIQADQELVVSDILARTPGVSFSRNGGPGETTSLNIRGAETDQTAVLIDGVKLNDPSSPGGGFNFADLLVGDISRIEVLRGPQSTLYGSQAIGGVVNIVTADPQKPFGGDLQLEGGSYGTEYGKASVGGREGALTWRLAADAYRTDGISAFDSRLGGREDDGYRNSGVSARLGYAFSPDVSLDLRGLFVQAHNDFDGFSTPSFTFGDDAETGSTRETLLYSGLNFALLDGRLQNRVAGQFTLTQRDNDDPTQSPTRTFDGRGTNARAEYQGSYLIAPGYTATFGAEHEREAITTSSPAFAVFGTPTTKAVDHIDSGYGQLQAEVLPGLNLTGGVRFDDHSTFGDHVTGQAAAAWSLPTGTVLRFSYGSGFKAPTLYQLYSEYGNTALRPEQAEGYDGGVEQTFWSGRGSVQVTGFDRTTDELIDFVFCDGGPNEPLCATHPSGGYYDNVARARAYGVEVSGALRPLEGLELTANYTFTDARDRSPGSPTYDRLLPRRPQDTANAQATYRWPFKLSTTAAVRYAGRSFDDAGDTTRLKSYTLVDLRASYPLRPGLELYARVENLFDYKYETIHQYGTLGRAGYAGVRASF